MSSPFSTSSFDRQFIGRLRVHPELGGLAEIRAQRDRRLGRYAASLVRQRVSSRSIPPPAETPIQGSPALLVRRGWMVGMDGDRCLLLARASDIVGRLHAHEGVHLHAEGLFNP